MCKDSIIGTGGQSVYVCLVTKSLDGYDMRSHSLKIALQGVGMCLKWIRKFLVIFKYLLDIT